ncbi:MAG: PEP-CTERM sorting domain-containing protein [Gammaproteobacteria bacterium]|nr:MAG: PEP-CTERM sorting domain-containing protein [Gammaproteobacteria bacterium]
MKLTRRLHALAFFSGALLFTQSASAYVDLTYQSNPLHFNQGYLGGQPDDDLGSDDPPYPSFSVNFLGLANSTASQALSGSVNVNFSEWPYQLENLSVINSNLTLDSTGNPSTWHFELALTQSSPGYSIGEDTDPNDYKLPTKTTWWFESTHGANTCNCDWYKYEDDLYIERAYYSWAYANTIGFLYGESNSPSNWTVNKVDVPEPSGYLLMLMGLIAVGATRLRTRKVS